MASLSPTQLLPKGCTTMQEACCRSLFYLATVVLGYDLEAKVHGPICRFFVQKDERRGLYDQDAVRKRLLLYPRGHFKTTIDMADILQWILIDPNVRILVMTGSRELATRMVKELKWHFQGNKTFRSLFPAYCPPQDSDWGTADEFTVPNRTKGYLREPTISISTIESVKAGSHYDIIKCDDLVNELNSATKEQIEKVIQSFHFTTPLLEPGGYRDVIGTRYDYSDLYGDIMEREGKQYKVMCKSAWETLPNGQRELLFPQRFTFAELEGYQKEDPYLFNCQYMNHPVPTESSHFSIKLLQTHIIPPEQVPAGLRYFMTWDLGFSQKSTADWSVGAVGGYDAQGNLYVTDILRGRYTAAELVEGIVAKYRQWPIIRVGIEDAGGSRLLQVGLDYRARDMRMYLPIDWLKTNFAGKNKKVFRVEGLQALLKADKLWFSSKIDCIDQLITEFVRFPKYRFDDLPDAISMLMFYKNTVDYDKPESTIEVVGAKPYGDDGDFSLGAGIVG